MKLDFQQPGALVTNQLMVPVGGQPGAWQFNQRSLKTRPTRLTCHSDLGGTVSQNI